MPDFDTDVLVVGGGPAGLAAAIASRRQGFRVLVADAAKPPIDKSCGEGLMPEALDALGKLGVCLPPGAGQPFRGIRFIDSDLSAQASFLSRSAIAIRRTKLHEILLERAADIGVALWWGAPVRSLSEDGAIVGDEQISCRWLIGADGGQSHVRRWAGLKTFEDVRYGFRRHYEMAAWTDFVEVYWGPDFQIYIAPVGPEEICVPLLARDPHLRLDDALQYFPDLAARFEGVPHLSEERGGISAMRRLSTVTQGRIALIGDASGSVDAITGQGICLAFQQALVLADCLASEDLEAYELAHRRIMRRPRIMARLLLSMGGHPQFRARAMRLFANIPAIFTVLLAVHAGTFPSRRIGSHSVSYLSSS